MKLKEIQKDKKETKFVSCRLGIKYFEFMKKNKINPKKLIEISLENLEEWKDK